MYPHNEYLLYDRVQRTNRDLTWILDCRDCREPALVIRLLAPRTHLTHYKASGTSKSYP